MEWKGRECALAFGGIGFIWLMRKYSTASACELAGCVQYSGGGIAFLSLSLLGGLGRNEGDGRIVRCERRASARIHELVLLARFGLR